MNSAALHGLAMRLRADRWLAEVVPALREVGVDPVLLKGPAIAQWLYAEYPLLRRYHDVDLLVAPHQHARAEDVLRQLGFTAPRLAVPGDAPTHANAWFRARDGAEIDLHRCLHGMERLPPERVWKAIECRLESQTIKGVEVRVPDEVVRTLHVALHVSWKDHEQSSPRIDLRRAVERVDRATWLEAVALARQLGVEAEMATRLRWAPETASLAHELGLTATVDEHFAFLGAAHDTAGTTGVLAVERLRELRGAARLRYVPRKLFPPPAFLRERSQLARRGRVGLAAAYALRAGRFIVRAPGAVVGWVRVRRHMQ